VAQKIGAPHVIGFANVAIGIAAHMGGRWKEARENLETGLAALRDHGAGVRWEIDTGDTYWLATLFYLGEWRELGRLTQLLLRDAIDRGDEVAQQALRTGRSNAAWLLMGKPDEAAAQLAASMPPAGEGVHLVHVSALAAAANIELYRGDVAAARAKLDELWPHVERLGLLRLQQPRVELRSLRARVLLADPRADGSLREAKAIADDLVKEGAVWAEGLGHLIRASCHAWAGQVDTGIADLEAAEAAFASAGMQGHVQIVRVYRGELEGGPGPTARALAARDFLKDIGAVDPDRVVAYVIGWPG
jgi:hypothetical protein